MRALLSLTLAAVLLSAGPLAEASLAGTPSCCGPGSPCAPAASAPGPVAIVRFAPVSFLPIPPLARSAALPFGALGGAKNPRPGLVAPATLRVRPLETSLRL